MLLGIITSIIGARYYGAEMVGTAAIINTVLGVGALLSIFGLSTAMIKLIPEYAINHSENPKQIGYLIYKKTLYIITIIAILVSLAFYFSSDYIANKVFHNPDLVFYLSLATFILIFRAIHDINIAMLRLLKQSKPFFIFEVLPKAIILGLLLITTFFYFNKNNIIYITLSIPVIMTFISSIYFWGYFSTYPIDKVKYKLPKNKTIISTAFPMMITNGMFFIIAQTDIIMLGIYRATAEVGIYTIVLSLSMLLTFVFNSIDVMAGPKFSELFHAGKQKELKYISQKSSKLSFFLSFPIIVGLIAFGKPILSIYGNEYIIGYSALMMLLCSQFISSVTGPIALFLNMTGHQKQFRNIILLASVINIVMNYYLIPIFGLSGAAFASLISVFVWRIYASIYIKVVFGFWILFIPFMGNKKKETK